MYTLFGDRLVGREVSLGPGDIVLDGHPAPPSKGAQQPPPTYRPMSTVAKRSPISAAISYTVHNIHIGLCGVIKAAL